MTQTIMGKRFSKLHQTMTPSLCRSFAMVAYAAFQDISARATNFHVKPRTVKA
jgi:hypothetical protein